MSDAAHLPAAPGDRRRFDVDSERALAGVRAPSLVVGIVDRQRRRARSRVDPARHAVALGRRDVHRGCRSRDLPNGSQRPVPLCSTTRSPARGRPSPGRRSGRFVLPSVFAAMLACAPARVAGAQAVRPLGRARERDVPRDQPVPREVVAAGARIHAPARGEPPCDAAPPPRARAGIARRVGDVRSCDRAAVVVMHAVAGLLLVPAQPSSSRQRREKLFPHGLLAARHRRARRAVGVRRSRCDRQARAVGRTGSIAPSPCVRSHAVLDISGAAGLGLLLAVVGLVVLRRAGRQDLAVWLGVWAFAPFVLALRSVVARPIFLDRYLDRRRSRVRAARGRRGDWASAGGSAHSRRSRPSWRRASASSPGTRRRIAETGAGRTGGAPSTPCSHGAPRRRGHRRPVVGSARGRRTTAPRRPGFRPPTRSGCSPGRRRATTSPSRIVATLGFGDHVLVEKQQFGWRVSAQLWKRPDAP